MNDTALSAELRAYGQWRSRLYDAIKNYRDWLRDGNLSDLRSHHQLERMLAVLNENNLIVAFVAEFSRGKTELINALFFSQFGRRLLPSGTGRTTMCPAELGYSPDRSPGIKLLPIETRADNRPLTEYKLSDADWVTVELDPEHPAQLASALSHLTETREVSQDEAERLDLPVSHDRAHQYGMAINERGRVEIPKWRHAMINMPHPLLNQGLVVLDTPGLNAIGAEPELTINQLSAAHAVIFILAADAGVTRTDLELWDDHIALDEPGATGESRLVVLNKIDTIWDDLRSAEEVEAEIVNRVEETATTLKVPAENIFPVSAQKGLLGRIRSDAEIIEYSRIRSLEQAIADRLIPAKQDIIRANIRSELARATPSTRSLVDQRLHDIDAHIDELREVSNKNTEVVGHIMQKVQDEKTQLEEHMQQFQATRKVFAEKTRALFDHISVDRLDKLIDDTRRNMSESRSTPKLQKCISTFFDTVQSSLDAAIDQSHEVIALSEKVTREFHELHQTKDTAIRPLLLGRYKQSIARLQMKHSHLKRIRSLFFKEQRSITNRFFDSVIKEIRTVFGRAGADAEDWSKSLMLPLETQVREHHIQLRRRLESVKRIHKASDSVQQRLDELMSVRAGIVDQKAHMDALIEEINRALWNGPPAEAVNS